MFQKYFKHMINYPFFITFSLNLLLRAKGFGFFLIFAVEYN